MSIYGQFSDAYPPVMDGVGVTVQNYARWLNHHGHTALVVAPRVPEYEETDPFEVVRVLSLPVPPRKPYRLLLPALSFKSRNRLNVVRFDLVHAHSPFAAGGEALRVARRHRAPIVATFHSKLRDDFLAAVKFKWLADLMTRRVIRFYDKVDAVWTVSDSTVTTLRSYGYKGRVDVIPNGCDLTGRRRDEAECAAVAFEHFDVPKEVPVILYVGQLARVKNPMLVVEAFAKLAREGLRHHLLMVGEGQELARLKALALDSGVEHRVHFTGVVHDREVLATLYGRACLLAFPSLYDNAPLVVREAAAMGCPPLLVAGSNAAEKVVDGENGFLAQSAQLEQFAAKMKAALADERVLSAAGSRARKSLAIHWEEIVKDVEGRYDEIRKEFVRRGR